MLASFPSPSFNSIGPLNLYGLCIALGVVSGVWLFGRRLEQRRVGTADDASSIAVWAVLAGVIGARLYHVATDWERFDDNLSAIPKIWEGGLGIPGGLLLGIPAGLFLARNKGIPIPIAATVAAPCIPVAQAIGRWGNYFNQELYGRATDLPWALEIDADHLVIDPSTGERFAVGTTFHPTFLYESLWSVATVVVLLYVDRRWRRGGGSLMALYVAIYGVGRFWVEGLRVDPADDVGPFRWNQWVALAAVVGGTVAYLVLRRRPEVVVPDESDDIDESDDADADVVDGDEPDGDHDEELGATEPTVDTSDLVDGEPDR